MSGTGTVLPVVAVAQSTTAKSNAVHSKMRSQTGTRDPSKAQDGKAVAHNNGKESMEMNLEGRVHTVNQGMGDDPKAKEGGTEAPRQVDFSKVLNQKLDGRVEDTPAKSEGDEAYAKVSEEFIFSPFVHGQAHEPDRLQANSPQQAGPQGAAQQQAPGQGQNTGQELALITEAANEGKKSQFQQVMSQNAENMVEVTAGKQDTSQDIQGVSETASSDKEAPMIAVNSDKMASEQGVTDAKEGVGVASKEVVGVASKEVVASETLDKAGKEVDMPVKREESTISTEQAKSAVNQEAGNFKQSDQGLDENAGQSQSNGSAQTGLQIEKADLQIDQPESADLKFEVPTAGVHSAGQEPVTAGFDVQDQGSQISANASVNAAQTAERAASGMEGPSVIKPIDQIIQQLNVNRSGTDQQIRLTLTPEDLGTVRITLKQVEGEIMGMVEVQKEQTRKEVEEAIPQLVSAMQNNGLQVRKVEVLQWNNPDQQQGKDQSSDTLNLSQERQFAQQQSQGSGNSAGSGNGHSGQGQGQTTQTGRIRVEDVGDSGQMHTQKGLNFLV